MNDFIRNEPESADGRDAIILRGRVLTPADELAEASVLIRGDRIAWVRPGREEVPHAVDLSANGDVIAPGLIDLQVNGFKGHDAAGGGEAINAISALLPATGVTGFLPTVISRPLAELGRFGRAVAATEVAGARVLGAHFEGPFLSPAFRGAHEQAHLRTPDARAVRDVVAARPRLVTVAPELPGALRAIETLAEAGIVVAAGHSGASAEQAYAAVDAGVRFGTHLFNAMARWHHREPGLAAALLADPRVTVGLVADGVHLHRTTVEIALLAAGAARTALTTDQTSAAGLPAGRYLLAGMDVESDGRAVARTDGTLAGTVATMDELVRRVASLPSLGLREAVETASLTPARLLGVDGLLGRVESGCAADLVVLDSESRVRLTLVGGRVVYRAAEIDGDGAVSGPAAHASVTQSRVKKSQKASPAKRP
ncbi:MAG: N-acetylglucosamine-6-phosphate deacetylase [Actinobacteria bacterium]|nr:N-acetylglucosamine-6-phosphate deacetylase [Actinomycetota bacterium]